MAGVDAGVLAFKLLAKRLQEAGQDGLREELYKAVGDAAVPIVEAIRRDVPEYMPRRGGYADALASDLNMRIVRGGSVNPVAHIQVKAGGAGGGASPRARRNLTGRKVKRLNAGLLTHPLFGDREHWYTQEIRPKFATGPFEEHFPQVRDTVLEAMARVAEKIAGKG